MHISSLPSEQGIGAIGATARQFIDVLANAGMTYWQICPLSPTGYGDSPYQSVSAFAGNPYFIDIEQLEDDGLFFENVLKKLPDDHVDFGKLYATFWEVLRESSDNFFKKSGPCEEFEKYCYEARWWLDDYSSFMAIKDTMHGRQWDKWPRKFANHASAMSEVMNSTELMKSKKFHQFSQFIFDRQWQQLKKYAHKKKISIIGDLPIFVGADSADVWANPDVFKINSNFSKKFVAGVPPDAFSKNGQLWGNPVYDWKKLSRDGYSWWIDRIRRCSELYDVIRLDHFRGYYDYWEVPSYRNDAMVGKWERAGGIKFFQTIKKHFPKIKLIAEDLGDLDEGSRELLSNVGIPGMTVMQFAFDSNNKNKYLPHNHEKNSVLYLGTHDNDTTNGWYRSLNSSEKHIVRKYLDVSGDDIAWDMIKEAFKSPCRTLILTMPDILNLGSEARFNTPGTTIGNWQWRMTADQFDAFAKSKTLGYLRELCQTFDR